MSKLSDLMPVVGIVKKYSKAQFRGDLAAGLTVGAMLVPQGMAYAGLAGMPLVYGLFSATVPLVVYGLLGSSRQLAIGPVAIMSLLIATGVGKWAAPGTPQYISLVLQLTLLTGLIQLVAGGLRLGYLANFLSRPVIHGFTSAAALVIIGSQVGEMLGVALPKTEHFHQAVWAIWNSVEFIHWGTMAIGIGGVAIIWGGNRLRPNFPGALVAMVLGTVVVYGMDLSAAGVRIVGEIPSGAPPFTVPHVSLESIQLLWPTAVTIAFVGFLESFSVAKAMEIKFPPQRVSANREFVALGSANIVGSFFSVFPVAGGFGRTAVNGQSGAKSGIASIWSALIVLLSLLFFTPLFTYLPKAVLAAVILVAVASLIDVKEALKLWRVDKRDFFVLLGAFVATLVLGIELGIGAAVVISLLLMVYRSSNPHTAVLGKLPATDHYMNVERFGEAEVVPGIMVFRFDGPLFFANCAVFKERIHALEKEHPSPLKLFVLDASAIHCIDSTAMAVLEEMVADFAGRNICFYTAFVRGPVRDTLRTSGLYEKIGESNHFMNVADAVNRFTSRHRKDVDECLSSN